MDLICTWEGKLENNGTGKGCVNDSTWVLLLKKYCFYMQVGDTVDECVISIQYILSMASDFLQELVENSGNFGFGLSTWTILSTTG